MTRTLESRALLCRALTLACLLLMSWQTANAQNSNNPGTEGGMAPLSSDALLDQVVLITGSTDGLGRMLAGQFAAMGAHVIIHGRNRERGEEVVRSIQADGRGSAEFHAADLGSLSEVRQLAAAIRDRHERLDILINNAGIWRVGAENERFTSVDGHELVFQVNYLSHFLLTHELLPLLANSYGLARIINVASAAQQTIDFNDIMMTENYSDSRAYAQSKLAQIIFTMELAPRIRSHGINVYSLHPATLMDTNMVQQAGAEARSTVEEGAQAVMQLAVGPRHEGVTGVYYLGMQRARANEQAYDTEARARLWQLSMELSGL